MTTAQSEGVNSGEVQKREPRHRLSTVVFREGFLQEEAFELLSKAGT